MENFDKVIDILVIIIPTIMATATLIVNATPSPRDDEIMGKIAYIVGRLFSFSTFKGEDGKANLSLPVVQSAKPKS
jgi:hypothetical protein